MESLFNLDLRMNTTRSKNSDATTNRTSRDIREAIDDGVEEEIRTFLVDKYSGSQMRSKRAKRNVVRISNRWTKSRRTPVSITLPPDISQKASFTPGVKTAPFFFKTASMTSDIENNKEPRDDNTTVCLETQTFFHTQKKNNT